MNNPNTHLFKHCPGCGEKKLSPDGEKSFICQECGFKFFLNSAAAGIALIFNTKKQVLVTVRKYDPVKGTLDFPGGFAEPGETMETCLIREINEELNLDIIDLKYFCSIPNQYLYKNILYSITDMVFICTASNFLKIKAQDEIAGFHFFDIDQLDITQFGLNSAKLVIEKIKASNF
ncbi:MAG: NUDIX domain-containing protein [Pseudomonadota bacterium]